MAASVLRMDPQSVPPQLWLAAFQLLLNGLGWAMAVRLLPEERVAIAHWAGFMLCLSLGLVLAGLRVTTGERPWGLYNGVNVATLTGFWLMRRGVERFLHTATRDRVQALWVVPPLLVLLVMPASEAWAPLRTALAYGAQGLLMLDMARTVTPPLRAEFGRRSAHTLGGLMALIGGVQLALALRQLASLGVASELHLNTGFNQGVMYLYLGGGAAFGVGFLQLVVLRLTHQLREASQRDALTQLFNRRAMAERLEAAWRQQRRSGRPLALLMLDLDHFKTVNDSQGHAAGDALLQRTAQLLSSRLRAEDLLARMGGEEFLIVLPDTDAAAAHLLAERLRTAAERELSVTLSLGLTLAKPDDPDADAALRRADAALYRAKAAGRNRVEIG